MSHRYNSKDGIVIRRKALPNGDVIVTLLNQNGKWRAIARKGKLIGGNLGKLSLFHDVMVQVYARKEDDLAVITQVQLNGALAALSQPDIYPYAHILAELVDKLTTDVHIGEQFYHYLASGLRGLAQHEDPEAVALVYAWRLLQQAGFAPQITRCISCGNTQQLARFDIAAGGLSCQHCSTGIPLKSSALEAFRMMLGSATTDAILNPPAERQLQWLILKRYSHYHIGELQSLHQRFSQLSSSPTSDHVKA